MKVLLASKSAIKVAAVRAALPDAELLCYESKCNDLRAANPINEGGMACALHRLNEAREASNGFDLIVVMENYLRVFLKLDPEPEDLGIVLVWNCREGLLYHAETDSVSIPYIGVYCELVTNYPMRGLLKSVGECDEVTLIQKGTSVTYGSLLHAMNAEIPADNWTKVCAGVDRVDLLRDGLKWALQKMNDAESSVVPVRATLRTFNDFPKPGVTFIDWSNLFLQSALLNALVRYICKKYTPQEYEKCYLSGTNLSAHSVKQIDYVIGIESRGYMLALPIATALECAFVPVKKPGKTVGQTLTQEYTKEYGTDVLELRADLPPGRVLIVDDVLATGGSMSAAATLAQRAGHTVVDCIALVDVPALRERAQSTLTRVPVRVILQ